MIPREGGTAGWNIVLTLRLFFLFFFADLVRDGKYAKDNDKRLEMIKSQWMPCNENLGFLVDIYSPIGLVLSSNNLCAQFDDDYARVFDDYHDPS